MELKRISDIEISDILEERKRRFNSYRINSKNFAEVKEEVIVDESKEVLNEQKEIIIENENIVFVRKEAVVEKEHIVVEEDGLSEQKISNGNIDATKTYNERMKGGFFGKRRRR